jgi:hypothetical protein
MRHVACVTEIKAYCESLVGKTERKSTFQRLRSRSYETGVSVNLTVYED